MIANHPKLHRVTDYVRGCQKETEKLKRCMWRGALQNHRTADGNDSLKRTFIIIYYYCGKCME